jgi:hypothetical protein
MLADFFEVLGLKPQQKGNEVVRNLDSKYFAS